MAIEIFGNWKKGFVFDNHMKSSTFLGHDEYGHSLFENSRSHMGELIYQLKYRNKIENSNLIVELLLHEFSGWESFDCIIPAPYSMHRINQPVYIISENLANRVNVPMYHILEKDSTTQLKNFSSEEQKVQMLSSSIKLRNKDLIKGKNILLIDDLFDSGATLSVSTQVLLDNGANSVCVLAMTKTKG